MKRKRYEKKRECLKKKFEIKMVYRGKGRKRSEHKRKNRHRYRHRETDVIVLCRLGQGY